MIENENELPAINPEVIKKQRRDRIIIIGSIFGLVIGLVLLMKKKDKPAKPKKPKIIPKTKIIVVNTKGDKLHEQDQDESEDDNTDDNTDDNSDDNTDATE